MEEIRLGSTKRFSDTELNRWITMQDKTGLCKAENQQLRILLSCKICRQNHIRCVLQCGHLTRWSCSASLVFCSVCGIPIRNRYGIYLLPPY